jgi:hypothetical protein
MSASNEIKTALPPRERAWAEALFEAILGPVEAYGLPSCASIDKEGFYRAIDSAPGPQFAPGLRGMVTAATLATVPSFGKAFHALDRETRVRAIEQLAGDERYVMRQILSTLKILATFA